MSHGVAMSYVVMNARTGWLIAILLPNNSAPLFPVRVPPGPVRYELSYPGP